MAEVLLGATGGAVGALVTTPMDVITIRIVTQEAGGCAADGELEDGCESPLGFFDMTRKVWDEGGAAALFRGWRARTGYWAPAIGIFLSCYCSLRQAAIGIDL